MTVTVGSLFSGIGGIDLGLQRAGFQIAWQVEIDAYCQKVLAKHWPHVARYGDIRECGSHNLSPVDLIAGGFPCQPHSLAGKRKASTDDRDLWGEFYRVICELRPQWVLAENVPGLLSSEDGRFFGRVLRDLAASGYDAEWQMLSAASVGAPHLRERIFIVAYLPGIRSNTWRPESTRQQWQTDTYRNGANMVDSQCLTSEQRSNPDQKRRRQDETQQTRMGGSHVSDAASTGLPFRGCSELATHHPQASAGMDTQPQRRGTLVDTDRQGLAVGQVFRRNAEQELTAFKRSCSAGAGIWAVEPGVGRVADGIPRRVDRLRGLGNAVVPQVAEYVGRCILANVQADCEVAS